MFYAGIGSRETPQDILDLMEEIGKYLGSERWVLRSGAAAGADTAFYNGSVNAGAYSKLYLPWRGYNKDLYYESDVAMFTPSDEAKEMAALYHPAWSRCKQGARKLHARNMHIVLGSELKDPVKMIICWTKDGLASGGTGQALRLAEAQGIRVHNLAFSDVRERIEKKIA